MLHWLRIVAFLVTGAIFGPLLLAGLHLSRWRRGAPWAALGEALN